MFVNKNRLFGIDVLKVIAVILVITVHFFLNTNYYNVDKVGISMNLQSIIRNCCMICVPLFMIITGFLNSEKEYNKRFFIKLLNILLVWLFYSIIEFTVLGIIDKNILDLNIRDLLYSISSFRACGYSWYVNMYIGLYLISPFINNTLSIFNRKNRLIVLFLSITVFIFPSFLDEVYGDIFGSANWWSNFYPVAYYISGKIIYYEGTSINKKALIVFFSFIQVFIFYCSRMVNITYTNFLIYLSAVTLFLIFYNIDMKNKVIKRIVGYLSIISFDIYLASSLIDKIMYPIFYNVFKFNIIGQHKVIIYAPIVLTIVFILSIIYSSIRKKLINVR